MNDTPLDCTGRPDCPAPRHLYLCRATEAGWRAGWLEERPRDMLQLEGGRGLTDEAIRVHYGPQARQELDRMRTNHTPDGTHYDVAADWRWGRVTSAIDRMVAERAQRSHECLERAVEEALQGGKYGVRAFSKEGEIVFAEPHESVPYGQMHMHTVNPTPLTMEPFRWPL